MSASTKPLVLMCHFFISFQLPIKPYGRYHAGILVYAPSLHISASSQSAYDQFLKIQVTRTPFQI